MMLDLGLVVSSPPLVEALAMLQEEGGQLLLLATLTLGPAARAAREGACGW